MNTINVAAQVTWPLQLVIAITFSMPLLGLAWNLSRPAVEALALGWVCTTLALLVPSLQVLLPDLDAQVPPSLRWAIILGSVGASVPAFMSAADALIAPQATRSWRALAQRALWWSSACVGGMVVVTVVLRSVSNAKEDWALALGRALLVAVYLVIAWHVIRVRRHAAVPLRTVLLVFAVALVVQSLRPLSAVLFFEGAADQALSDPRGIAFIMVNVVITTTFGLACILMAVTEERSAVEAAAAQLREAALRAERALRLESVGRLATGVAHDFNNFLAIIKGGTGLARDRIGDGEFPDEELQAIDDAADRGAALTRQLLVFARQQPQQVTVFDAVARVQQMHSLLQRMIGRQITLTLDLPSASRAVSMDPTQFDQILLNLVSNARDAMGSGGGRITVQLAHSVVVPGGHSNNGDLAAGEYVALSVADTGRGISPAVIPSIFEPFFTTRQDDGGTGLGLATVQSIVRQSGGDVAVESVVGVGTTFTVLLPALAPAS